MNRWSIEHIMPQQIDSDFKPTNSEQPYLHNNVAWKAMLGGDNQWQKIHDTWLNRLANLTILPLSVNSDFGNTLFKDKQSAYRATNLPMNIELASLDPSWNLATLEERNDRILQLLEKAWVYPFKD